MPYSIGDIVRILPSTTENEYTKVANHWEGSICKIKDTLIVKGDTVYILKFIEEHVNDDYKCYSIDNYYWWHFELSQWCKYNERMFNAICPDVKEEDVLSLLED